MSYIIWVKELGILITINKCNIYLFIYLLTCLWGCQVWLYFMDKITVFYNHNIRTQMVFFFFFLVLCPWKTHKQWSKYTLHSFIHILFNFGAVITWKVYIFKIISSKIQTHHICSSASQSFFFSTKAHAFIADTHLRHIVHIQYMFSTYKSCFKTHFDFNMQREHLS